MDETLSERHTPSSKAPALTDQEQQILALIADGKTNPQIADALFQGRRPSNGTGKSSW